LHFQPRRRFAPALTKNFNAAAFGAPIENFGGGGASKKFGGGGVTGAVQGSSLLMLRVSPARR